MSQTPHLLVFTAIASAHTFPLSDLMLHIEEAGCHVVFASHNTLGGIACAQFLLQCSWSAAAKLEAVVPNLQTRLGISIGLHRTHERDTPPKTLPYTVQLQAPQRPGTIAQLCAFFAQQHVTIVDMRADVQMAPRTHTPLLYLAMVLDVPEKVHLAALREQFMIYCEDRNIDAVLEPQRYG